MKKRRRILVVIGSDECELITVLQLKHHFNIVTGQHPIKKVYGNDGSLLNDDDLVRIGDTVQVE